MEFFGHLERFLSEDLYPYRIPLTIAAVVVLAALVFVAWRRGWLARAVRGASARPLPSALAAVLVLAVVLPAGYYLLSPLWIRTALVEASPLPVAAATAVATSSATPATLATTGTPATGGDAATPASTAFQPRTVLEGEWMGADDFHFARGRALVIETAPMRYVLRVEDFAVRNGPDLFVYLSPDGEDYTDEAIELGTLKATEGAFNYDVPEGMSLDEIRSAVIWCKQFAVLFGTATFIAPA